jgi:superfamily I DNA/RNA helicase
VSWLTKNGRAKREAGDADTVKVVTFHSSKGLEYPVVAIPGLGYLPNEREDEAQEIRLAYVAMTRAMDRLIMTYHRESPFVRRVMAAAASAAPVS